MGTKNFGNIDGNNTSIDKTVELFMSNTETVKKEESKPKAEHKQSKYSKDKSQLVAFRVNPDQWDDLKYVARIDGVSVSAVIDRLITKELKARSEEIDKLKEIKK